MSRPRTPTAILEQRGSFLTHKDRKEARANEPVPNAPIRKSPPASLDQEQRRVWFEFIRKIPAGVLGDCDEYWLAMAVRSECKERKGTITISERTQYMNLLGKLGMNPSERTKVVARPVAKKDDGWSDLDEPQQTM
jgi:hypothetical protein